LPVFNVEAGSKRMTVAPDGVKEDDQLIGWIETAVKFEADPPSARSLTSRHSDSSLP
jgi:hypothetical protein